MRTHASIGVQGLSLLLNRSTTAIKAAANRYRISLRPAGETRGLLLGQPRNVHWMEQIKFGISTERLAAIKAEAIAGTFDLAVMEDRIRSEKPGGKRRPICPSCGARPQDHTATGLCSVCHIKGLAQSHRDNHAVTEANRELWRTKQEASRARRNTLRKENIVDLETDE